MRGSKVLAWEKTLKGVFDRIDARLEQEYGGKYLLRPNRPKSGWTSNPEFDGLFDVGAVFSAGFGSEHGRGYIVKVNMSTLSRVPADVISEIEGKVVAMLEEMLPIAFPNQHLRVVLDGHLYKIIGDFKLD